LSHEHIREQLVICGKDRLSPGEIPEPGSQSREQRSS
jgi:hypothetical protein